MIIRDAQAKAWKDVCKVLNEVCPGWWNREGMGSENAVEAIRNLANNSQKVKRETTYPALKAMVLNYKEDGHVWDKLDAKVCLDAAEEIQELREALTHALAQCIGWQGEPNEYSCQIHKEVVKLARNALRS